MKDRFTAGAQEPVDSDMRFLGESQIVDANGRELARRPEEEGEGVVIADVEVGHVEPGERIPVRFWIPERERLPAFLHRWFYENRPKGEVIYNTHTRPYRNGELVAPANVP